MRRVVSLWINGCVTVSSRSVHRLGLISIALTRALASARKDCRSVTTTLTLTLTPTATDRNVADALLGGQLR
jgi:hypothetical protein